MRAARPSLLLEVKLMKDGRLAVRALLCIAVCAPNPWLLSARAHADPPPTPPPAAPAAEPAPVWDASDVKEDPNKRYYFIGLRYRGTIVPQAFESLFVDEGATVYSNSIGIELDSRKDGSSLIPSITYTDYNTGNILFHQKNTANTDNNWSYVNSSLKAIYLAVDQLWSVPMAKNVQFEYGFGAGVGFVFGNLVNNWVYANSTGPLVSSEGQHFSPCQTQNDAPSCSPSAHQNAQTAKVGGYVEPNWFNGGSVPTPVSRPPDRSRVSHQVLEAARVALQRGARSHRRHLRVLGRLWPRAPAGQRRRAGAASRPASPLIDQVVNSPQVATLSRWRCGSVNGPAGPARCVWQSAGVATRFAHAGVLRDTRRRSGRFLTLPRLDCHGVPRRWGCGRRPH